MMWEENNLSEPEVDVSEETAAQSAETAENTCENGFYTKPHEDIIQDELKPTAEPPRESGNHFDPFTGKPLYEGAEAFRAQPQSGKKPPRAKKEKRRYGAGIVILCSVLSALIGLFGGIAANDSEEKSPSPQFGGTPSNIRIEVDETAESIVEAVATKASPSVVGIRTTTSVMSFFGGSQEATGEGSGVVYSSDGYIITNYHVIESVAESGDGKIAVFFNNKDSDSYAASIVGYHIASDLALLKIDATGLPAVELGNSDELKIGQQVVAIGSPGGLEFMGSVTSGYISGLNRVLSSASNVQLIQTDAAINPGNSGGALLNAKGQLVGINSSKIVSTEFEGMGFSIPINAVVEMMEKIIDKQNTPEPYVGLTLSTRYTKEVLNYYRYPAGAVVLSVDEDSPADKAGIRRGDIITEFDGKTIEDYNLLNESISYSKPGDTVTVKLYRSGKYYETDLKIASNGK